MNLKVAKILRKMVRGIQPSAIRGYDEIHHGVKPVYKDGQVVGGTHWWVLGNRKGTQRQIYRKLKKLEKGN